MDNIIKVQFRPPASDELIDRILELLFTYSKDLTLAEAVGVLELVKITLLETQEADDAP